jgi:hypothetical protein
MLTLLIAAALGTQVIPTATVHFPRGHSVTVSGPGSDADRLVYGETSPWINTRTLFTVKKDVAAVQFCISHTKEEGCIVYLVRTSGRVQELENSDVKPLIWTGDGTYLIGAGVNTVRLWDLSGAVRLATPVPPLINRGAVQSSSEIIRLWLDAGSLCVATRNQLYSEQGEQMTPAPQTPESQRGGMTLTTTRYLIPSLKRLTSTTSAVGPKLQEADCTRVRRSD